MAQCRRCGMDEDGVVAEMRRLLRHAERNIEASANRQGRLYLGSVAVRPHYLVAIAAMEAAEKAWRETGIQPPTKPA